MKTNWEVGDAFTPKDPLTHFALACGLQVGKEGHITHIAGGDISFELSTGYHSMDAVCSIEVFGLNFLPRNKSANPLYRRARPYTKRFPDAFMR